MVKSEKHLGKKNLAKKTALEENYALIHKRCDASKACTESDQVLLLEVAAVQELHSLTQRAQDEGRKAHQRGKLERSI